MNPTDQGEWRDINLGMDEKIVIRKDLMQYFNHSSLGGKGWNAQVYGSCHRSSYNSPWFKSSFSDERALVSSRFP